MHQPALHCRSRNLKFRLKSNIFTGPLAVGCECLLSGAWIRQKMQGSRITRRGDCEESAVPRASREPGLADPKTELRWDRFRAGICRWCAANADGWPKSSESWLAPGNFVLHGRGQQRQVVARLIQPTLIYANRPLLRGTYAVAQSSCK